MMEAADLKKDITNTFDFFYIKTGRPSDWQEYKSIEKFLTGNFNEGSVHLHVINISNEERRIILCGDDESTYTRFGLSAAFSLVAAKCETLKDKPDVIMFGIHGADARFKARKSNEYTRYFVNSWNKFWMNFYPSAPVFVAPLIDVFDKVDILKMAKPLNISLERTWSCYRGDKNHCGECKSCLERRLAYQIAELPDLTDYTNTPKLEFIRNTTRAAVSLGKVIN